MTSIPFRPLVREWFVRRFTAPTVPQAEGWPAIGAGDDTLIAAPTGSGKTLAAFLWCLDDLIGRDEAQTLEARTYVVYISPLKALSNDVTKNLSRPLAELEADAGRPLGIDVQVRTGDTTAYQRAKMAKKPPHVLVTTPESLYILLTSERGRSALSSVRTVIVDEIHAIAGDKRGAHLALSLERLDHLVRSHTGRPPQRIGLSATQKPIDVVGALLVGNNRPAPTIVDAGFSRQLDVAVEVPTDELGAVATHEMMAELRDRIVDLCAVHRTTIVFVNTRRLVERMSHALGERMGEERVAAHHGSLSKETRLDAEQRLKAGTLSVIVATASLELGIDVGDVDLVVQVGSPRSIATFLQRVGRSGHCLRAIPKGRIFALTRDQLVEAAALIRAVEAKILDALEIPPGPLDVLAQQIVAACAVEVFDERDLFDMIRGAYHYRDLTEATFESLLAMLADGFVTQKGRRQAYVKRDRIHGTVHGRRNAKLVAITSGGAIPDTGAYAVIAEPDEMFVGTLDEDFAIESSAGDIFLLGNTSWRIRRVESARVRVEDAKGLPPTVPFWRGEAPARTRELSAEVSKIREDVSRRIDAGEADSTIASWLEATAAMPRRAAEQLVDYLSISKKMLGALPTTDTIVAERFFDEAGGMQLILHAPFGARVNRAWGIALRKRFCKSFNFELQAAATDDGVLISLGPVHSFPLEAVFSFLNPATVRDVLEQAVLQAPMFTVRWRWAAQRALAVPRRQGGKKVPAPLMRMRTDDLLTGVFPMAAACQDNIVGPIEIPDHPLVFEAMRDCLEEAMDIDGLIALLSRIDSGDIRIVTADTPEPSPLSHELVNANPYAFLDDAPLEERRARAVSMRRGLPKSMSEIGALDPEAIRAVAESAAHVVRDSEDLHDLLDTLIVVPEASVPTSWRPWFEALVEHHRATTIVAASTRFWIASEQRVVAAAMFKDAVTFEPPLVALPFETTPSTPEQATVRVIRAFLETSSPRTAEALAAYFDIGLAEATAALFELEAQGTVLRGKLTPGPAAPATIEWCDRRILARIHRQTVGRLRKSIEPVTPADFLRFLFSWQHVTERGRLHGMASALQIVRQLQGFQAAAPAWEEEILPARIADFDRLWIDQMCLGGEVTWGRLSLRDGGDGKVITRAARITLVLRESLPWLLAEAGNDEAASAETLTPVARAIYRHLVERGASFLRDFTHTCDANNAEIADALEELVFAGLATSDGYSRPWGGRSWGTRPSAGRSLGAGRWSRLRQDIEPVADRFAFARQLLLRYGVVFRDVLQRESHPPPWRDLLVVLRRMEARGEIRGGRFVSGFVGEQYALPEAVDAMRAIRRDRTTQIVRIAATDPLNLVGILTPGPRIPAVCGQSILFENGVVVRPSAQELPPVNLRAHEQAR